MSWHQHLFSKRIRNQSGHVDGFHTLTDTSSAEFGFLQRVPEWGRPDKQTLAFIMDCGDRVLVGLDGRVCDVLEKNEFAFERPTIGADKWGEPRRITFTHGYLAKKGAPIPEIGELVNMQRVHLDEILRRANSGEEPVRIAPVEFKTRAGTGSLTDWERHAQEFSFGKRSAGECAMFRTDGSFYRVLEGTKDGAAAQPAKQAESAAGKLTHVAKGKGFWKVFNTSLCVVVVGVAAWILLKKTKEKPQEKPEMTQSVGR